MAIWIQSLSWTLIYSLAQGITVFAALWLVLKIVPARSANVRYHLALSALTILLAWFVATWWQQFHSLTLAGDQLASAHAAGNVVIWPSLHHVSLADSLNNWRAFLSSMEVLLPWLSAFYIVGLVLMLARLSAGILHLYSLRSTGTFPPGISLDAIVATQKKQIGINSPVKLLISVKAKVPMVIGFLKPVILIPAAAVAQLDPAQLETIILHELAHIRRHDYLVNIFQTIVETILFFNPFVWVISAITRREREHCCDDLVVSNTTEPASYATALATLAAHYPVVPPMVVAATGKPTHLYNRILRIMETKKNRYSYSRMVATVIIITAITGSIAWLKPSFPKVEKSKSVAAAQKQAAQQVADASPVDKANDRPVTTNKKTTATEVAKAISYTENKKIVEIAAVIQKPDDNTIARIPDENRQINLPTGDQPVDQQKTPVVEKQADLSEENQLVNNLMSDNLVDQVKGFVVEKRRNILFINGVKQTDEIARKYLSSLKKDILRIQVFSFDERMRMHPDASFIQLLLPATFESPCIDKSPPKEGC